MSGVVPSPRRTKEIVVGAIIVLLFAALYALTLSGYIQEGVSSAEPYEFGDPSITDHILARAKILSLDPVKGEMAVRIDLTPQGKFTDDQGFTATTNFKVFVNSANGSLERSFDKGKVISPFDITINLDGLVNNYPFDQYDGELVVYASIPPAGSAQETEIPVVVELTANIPGFAITAAKNDEATAEEAIVDLRVHRSVTVIAVAVAGMVIMWAIGIAVIFLTLSFVLRNRKAEAFAFYSGLLFGLFGLRNSMPGTPPIGTQSDFLAFLWVEAIVAIMMVLTIGVSLVRPQK